MAPSIWQILIVVILVVLLFGAGRLPQTMENLAKGIKSFKKGLKDEDENEKPPVLKDEKTADRKD